MRTSNQTSGSLLVVVLVIAIDLRPRIDYEDEDENDYDDAGSSSDAISSARSGQLAAAIADHDPTFESDNRAPRVVQSQAPRHWSPGQPLCPQGFARAEMERNQIESPDGQ